MAPRKAKPAAKAKRAISKASATKIDKRTKEYRDKVAKTAKRKAKTKR